MPPTGLYVCYQVIAYLEGLTLAGYRMVLLTFAPAAFRTLRELPSRIHFGQLTKDSLMRLFRGPGGLCVIFVLTCFLQLAALKWLPYASCLLETASIQDDAAPTRDFRIGGLHWDVPSYTVDPALEPFRSYFRAHGGDKSGRAAALRVAHDLRQGIPFGQPQREFFQYSYDPSKDFAAHLEGEPGHCVTLSGFLAASLLSAGIPARVVQFVPGDKATGGHNLVEVWDEQIGWSLIDPSFDGSLAIRDRPCSAIQALQDPANVRWVGRKATAGTGSPKEFYESKSFPLHDGHVIYPEPWLYLRTGLRSAPWPFRGRFVLVGQGSWKYGPAQAVLRYGIVICGTIAVLCLALKLARRVRKAPCVAHQRALSGPNGHLDSEKPTRVLEG